MFSNIFFSKGEKCFEVWAFCQRLTSPWSLCTKVRQKLVFSCIFKTTIHICQSLHYPLDPDTEESPGMTFLKSNRGVTVSLLWHFLTNSLSKPALSHYLLQHQVTIVMPSERFLVPRDSLSRFPIPSHHSLTHITWPTFWKHFTILTILIIFYNFDNFETFDHF